MNSNIQSSDVKVSIVEVRLHAGLSRGEQSRFFRSMRHAMRRRSMVMTSSNGTCLILAVSAEAPTASHAAMSWLIEQPAVCGVVMTPSIPLQMALQNALALDDQDAAIARPAGRAVSRQVAQSLIIGLILQAVRSEDREERLQ